MRAEAAESVDFCFHAHGFSEDSNFLLALDETPSEGAVALESHNHNIGRRLPEVVFEVMKDASRVAHSSACHDEAGSVDFVDAARLFGGCGGFEGSQVVLKVASGEEGTHFFVEQLGMAGEDACGLDGHGAIEEDREGGNLPVAKHGGEEEGEHLGATHGEGGDEDVAFIGSSSADDGPELFDGFCERTVITVAIGAFEKDGVRLGEGFELFENGGVDGSEVAGEDNPSSGGFLLDEQLKARGAEHVSSFGPDHLDAGRDGNWLSVRNGSEAGEDGFDVVWGVEGRFVGMASATVAFVLAFGIGGLDSGGVAEDEAGEFDGGGGGQDGAVKVCLGEEGEASDVVEVGVGDEDCVWDALAEPCEVAVEFIGAAAPLEEAAVDEKSGVVVFEEVARAGDFATGGAERGDGEHGVWGRLRIWQTVFAADGADDEVGFECVGIFIFG